MAAQAASTQTSTVTKKNSLISPPGNLKEAVDWIIRVCDKDGHGVRGANGAMRYIKELIKEVNKLLKGAEEHVRNLQTDVPGDALSASAKLAVSVAVLSDVSKNTEDVITKLADKLAIFIGYNNGNGDLGGQGIGNPGKCSCPTIVQCADVLPLFFKYGFVYYDHSTLNKTGDTGRKCSQFATQLNAVINGLPFSDLIAAINKFLYHIRQPFLLYLLTFWLLAITYLTHSLTIPLDVLHLRSHLRTSLFSPLVLLGKNKSPIEITYFTP
ncbi:uncharacterized protein BXIN_1868 [Babesia sp. Xinjiang]|uniref:uncharacterized protein n=1 Tax=Babesia sp. Xinjiang TaxID=462227 RepID=UPI000A24AC93|nr:uncharacterized protein BXIN_1868 [Babesia sp. Xinjiang]ORM40408.1 hypothetical protein BXIN_1868 [Babesia sp. Xinjiang]